MVLVQKEVKAVYLGDTKVRPSAPFTPGANTICYFPFKVDGLDKTGNYTLSNTGTQGTIGRVFNAASNFNTNTPATGCFISMRIKPNSVVGGGTTYPYVQIGNCICESKGGMCYTIYDTTPANNDVISYWTSSSSKTQKSVNKVEGQWMHLCRGYDGTGGIMYKNGVATRIATGSPYSRGTSNNFIKLAGTITSGSVELSEVIAETVCWTADEISTYYNRTKGNYGL